MFQYQKKIKKISFDKESLDALKESGAEVEIEMGELSFNIPAEMLADFEEQDIVIENGTLSSEEVKGIKGAKTEAGVNADIISDVYEIEFKSGSEDIEIGAENQN